MTQPGKGLRDALDKVVAITAAQQEASRQLRDRIASQKVVQTGNQEGGNGISGSAGPGSA